MGSGISQRLCTTEMAANHLPRRISLAVCGAELTLVAQSRPLRRYRCCPHSRQCTWAHRKVTADCRVNTLAHPSSTQRLTSPQLSERENSRLRRLPNSLGRSRLRFQHSEVHARGSRIAASFRCGRSRYLRQTAPLPLGHRSSATPLSDPKESKHLHPPSMG